MKNVLILILTLIPLLALSQTATIDQINQTTTLDKAKTIDVAKIIKNEERLRAYAKELESYILSLNDSIQKLTQYNIASIDDIKLLNETINLQYTDIIEIRDRQLLEVKRIKFYPFMSVGVAPKAVRSIDLGGALITKKRMYTFGVGFTESNKMVYKIGFGLKL